MRQPSSEPSVFASELGNLENHAHINQERNWIGIAQSTDKLKSWTKCRTTKAEVRCGGNGNKWRKEEKIKCGIYWEYNTKETHSTDVKKTQKTTNDGAKSGNERERKRIKKFSFNNQQYTNGAIYLLNVEQNKMFENLSNNKTQSEQKVATTRRR